MEAGPGSISIFPGGVVASELDMGGRLGGEVTDASPEALGEGASEAVGAVALCDGELSGAHPDNIKAIQHKHANIIVVLLLDWDIY